MKKLDKFKKVCYLANQHLKKKKLVVQSFGNVSIRLEKIILIKPSGINLSTIDYKSIVPVNIVDKKYKGTLKPSSDTPTHIELYKNYKSIKSVVHTHSPYATSWAQAGLPIPCFGTTHADFWKNEIPITRKLEKKEVKTKSQKKTKFIEEKPVVEDVENIVSDSKEATQTILELHQGLKDISGKNSTVLKSTTKLINETYYSEEMLNMIIGDSWKNADNQTKKKMIDVFEEYIAKNYIKRFSKIKYPQFSNLEEKKVGKYKMIKSNLILSKDEKVSINYLLSLKNEKWKIFDVLLAGSVSEIATKKSEFKSFIKDGDINPLIEALSKKNKILLTK